jgi:hypothetical protein
MPYDLHMFRFIIIFVLYFTMNDRPRPQKLNPEVDGGGGHSQNGEPDSALILCPMPLISDMPGGLTLHNMNTKPKPELKEYHKKWQTGHKLS